MPIARLFARLRTRRAALFTVSLIALAALAPLIPVQTTKACPEAPPSPLRELYINSSRIVVARIGETATVEDNFDAESSYHQFTLRTVLRVAETVKGEGGPSTVDVYHYSWAKEGELHEQRPHDYSEYSPDDKLLIFLRQREQGNGYEVTDYRFAIKKLSDADLRVYLQRIDELEAIMQQAEPDETQIIEWLIRCAEEPATMWEGVYELATSYNAMLAENQRQTTAPPVEETAAKEAEATDAGNAEKETPGTEATETANGNGASNTTNDTPSADNVVGQQIVEIPFTFQRSMIYQPYTPDLARSLTDEHKSRLSALLFKAKTIGDNEALLIDLVRHWNDARLLPFILAYLHSVADDPPYMAEQMTSVVAELLQSQELAKLAERYSANATYQDETGESAAEEHADEAEEGAAEAEESAATQETAGEAEAQADESEAADEEEDPEEKLLSGTHTQKRSARLRRFLSLATSLAAQ